MKGNNINNKSLQSDAGTTPKQQINLGVVSHVFISLIFALHSFLCNMILVSLHLCYYVSITHKTSRTMTKTSSVRTWRIFVQMTTLLTTISYIYCRLNYHCPYFHKLITFSFRAGGGHERFIFLF